MSEKDYPQEENQLEEMSKKKTIDLAEWQLKNSAYLEKRAKEKARLEDEKNESFSNEEDETIFLENSESEEAVVELKDDEAIEETLNSENPSDSEIEGDEPEINDDIEDEETGEDEEPVSEVLSEEVDSQLQEVKRTQKKRDQRHLSKYVPFFVVLGFLILSLLYLVSPLSSIKHFKVSGLVNVTAEQVLVATELKEYDYTVSTALNRELIADKMVENLVWVKDANLAYEFPFTFQVAIEEHIIVGYVKDGTSYYPVLSSGDTIDAAVTEEALPEQYMLFKLADLTFVKEFIVQLEQADLLSLINRIQTVELSPTQATTDLLNLTMREGHTVLVPLTELSKKMVFYELINAELASPSYIDMEAGIYTYAK